MPVTDDLATRLEAAGVATAWLFGSRARGNERADSDADVALLLRAKLAAAADRLGEWDAFARAVARHVTAQLSDGDAPTSN